MQSDPVKNVATTGLLGVAGFADLAKGGKDAVDGKAFTEEVKKLMAAAELAESAMPAGGTPAGLNTAANGNSQIAEHGLESPTPDAESADADETNGIEELYGLIPPEDKLRVGSELLAQAIKRIAAILGLPDEGDASPNFEFDPANIEQLAAIMAYLDLTIKMANDRIDVSANAESANMAMAAYGMESPIADIEVEENAAELSEFAAALRSEKFRMDMAFRLIGVSGMIAEKIAEKSGDGAAIGIPQAVNPADLGMSVADTVSAFSNLIREELSASADRVRQIVRGQAEMTDVERAAIELGTVKSEILKAALNKAKAGDGATTNETERDSDSNSALGNIFKAGINTNAARKGNADAGVSVRVHTNTNVNANVNVDTNVDTGTDTAHGKADVNTGVSAGVNTNVNTDTFAANGKTAINPDVKVSVNTNVNVNDNAGFDINTDTDTNVNAKVGFDTNTGNGKSEVNTGTDNTGANTSVNTAVNAGINTNVGTDVNAEASVKTEADVGTYTANAKVSVNTDTVVKPEVTVDTNTQSGNTGVNTDPFVKTEALFDTNTVNSKADVDTGVNDTIVNNAGVNNTAADTAVNTNATANHANSSNANSGVNANANTDTNANTNAFVNTDAFVKTEANVDTNTANDKVGVNTDVNTDINTNADVAADNANRANRHGQKDPATGNSVTVSTGINKAADTRAKAPGKSPFAAGVKFGESISVDTDTDSDNDHDVKVNPETKSVDNAQKRAATTDLPLSAHDSASRHRLSSVESANRLASKSAERGTAGAMPSSAGDGAELPISVMAMAHGKKAAKSSDSGDTKKVAAEPQTQSHTKNTVADGETAELPVSVMEASDKKHVAKKGHAGHTGGAKAAAKAAASAIGAAIDAATAKTENAAASKAADEAFVAKLKQTVEVGGLIKSISSGKASGDSAAKSVSSAKDSVAANSGSLANNAVNNVEAGADLSVDNGDGAEVGATGSVDSTSPRSTATKNAERAEAAAPSQDERLEVIRQLSEKLSNAVRIGANEIRMTLRPEALGEVRMSIRMQGDVVFAKMQVESKQVKAIVESNLQSLKDSLQKQNIEFGAIDVEVGAHSDGDKSPRQLWQEMAERSESRGSFRENNGVSQGGMEDSDNFVSVPMGSDTGRRFGDNTFEYFA